MEERLQKVIAQSGYTSRRKAEELIQQGKVTVNGEVVTVLGTKVTKKDTICVNGKIINKEDKVYYLFYDRTCVADYFADSNERVYPVGRLDYDTTGALFMTNDGEFANLIMHPSSHLEKVYEVSVKGLLTKAEKNQLEKGIYLEGVKTLPCEIAITGNDEEHGTTMLLIRLVEGKNRQIKKMFEEVGHPVKRLRRIMIGPIDLKGLTPGTYRRLKPHEVNVLRTMALKKKNANKK